MAEILRMNKRLALFLGTVLTLTAAGAAVYMLSAKSSMGNVAFTTLKGERIQLRDLRGKVVLVNFWATTCPACVKEMPELVKTYHRYHPKGLEIIAVAMSYDSPVFVKEFAEQHALPFPVALDTQEEAARAFGGVKAVPTTLILNKEGRLVSRTLGMIAFDKLHAYLDQALH